MSGCGTCKSECGREDGCGTRKSEQKQILDGLIATLYPTRRFGELSPAAPRARGLSRSDVESLGRQVEAVTKAPVYVVPGGRGDRCRFLYVLCMGREPALVELRAQPALGALEAPSVRERYLRIACSTVGRLACVQEVAMELDTDAPHAPEGMATIRELASPGVFDPKLLKRFQRIVDLLGALGIEHLDLGLLDVPAAEFGLDAADYEARYGVSPALLNYFFYAQPVTTATTTYVPLAAVPSPSGGFGTFATGR